MSPVGRKLFPFRTDPFSEKGLGHRKANMCYKTYLPCKMAEPASVAQLDPRATGDQEVAGSTPPPGRQHYFVEIDHDIFSTVILALPLIQEGQLSVSGENICTVLVNRSED